MPDSVVVVVVVVAVALSKSSLLRHSLSQSLSPSASARFTGAAWSKKHWGWASRVTKGGADSHSDYLAEGKIEVTSTSDPHYLARPIAFYCSDKGRGRDAADGSCQQAADMKLYKCAARIRMRVHVHAHA